MQESKSSNTRVLRDYCNALTLPDSKKTLSGATG